MRTTRIFTVLLISVSLILSACTTASISILPSLGAFLTNSQNVSSEVLLKDVQVIKAVADMPYIVPFNNLQPIKVGESILVVSITIQNKHKQNKEIEIYAEGYDDAGKQVSWTLDAAQLSHRIVYHLESEEVGQFTLHLNMSDNIKNIHIFANNYAVRPPS